MIVGFERTTHATFDEHSDLFLIIMGLHSIQLTYKVLCVLSIIMCIAISLLQVLEICSSFVFGKGGIPRHDHVARFLTRCGSNFAFTHRFYTIHPTR